MYPSRNKLMYKKKITQMTSIPHVQIAKTETY